MELLGWSSGWSLGWGWLGGVLGLEPLGRGLSVGQVLPWLVKIQMLRGSSPGIGASAWEGWCRSLTPAHWSGEPSQLRYSLSVLIATLWHGAWLNWMSTPPTHLISMWPLLYILGYRNSGRPQVVLSGGCSTLCCNFDVIVEGGDEFKIYLLHYLDSASSIIFVFKYPWVIGLIVIVTDWTIKTFLIISMNIIKLNFHS